MDLTKEYILMCEKATEIQSPMIDHEDGCFIGEETDFWTLVGKNKDKYVWLPRQDQLFDMVDWKCSISKTNSKYSWAVWHGDAGYGSFNDANSCEQALLNMIMIEKYNKSWDGTEWATTLKQ